MLTDREGIGDILLKMPFVHALARAYPGHPVWWIASFQSAMADLLRPYTDATIARVVEHTGILGSRRAALPSLAALPPFSIVFDTRTRISSVWLAWRTLQRGAYFTLLPAFALSHSRPPGRWLRPRCMWRRVLSLAEAAVGHPLDPRGTLRCSPETAAAAAAILPPGPCYVGLAPGSREARKNWPAERFRALGERLIDDGLTPVVILGPYEEAMIEAFTPLPPGMIVARLAHFAQLPQRGPIDPAIALCRQLALIVANDGGMGHIAGAAGLPVVSLFGPTDPRRMRPFAPDGEIVDARDFGSTKIDAIPVAPVHAATLALLHRREHPAASVTPEF